MRLQCCFISYVIAKRATGLSRYLSNILQRLLERGYDLRVPATNFEYSDAGGSDSTTLDARARIMIFPAAGILNRRLFCYPAPVSWLEEHDSEFSLIHSHGMWDLVNFPSASAARKRGFLVVATRHGMLADWYWSKRKRFKDALHAWQGRAMLDRAAAVRMLSTGGGDATAGPMRVPVHVIPNAATPVAGESQADPRQAVRAHLCVPKEKAVVLFLGRISHQGGSLDVVHAVAYSQSGANLGVIGTADQDPAYAERKTLAQTRRQDPSAGSGLRQRQVRPPARCEIIDQFEPQRRAFLGGTGILERGLLVIMTQRPTWRRPQHKSLSGSYATRQIRRQRRWTRSSRPSG